MIDEPRVCPNCGTPATDRFCPRCGQEQSDRLVSTRRMFGDLLEDTFSLEARLPRTLGRLVFSPGFLTREYTVGRVARYIHPVRLYVVASLVFFLVLSFVADFDRLWSSIGDDITSAADERYALIRTNIDVDRVPGPLKPLARAWLRQENKLNALERREGVRVLYDASIGAVPPIVFLLVPFFALVLKGLYRRRLYVEHAVFVLHLHALGFLLAAVALLLWGPYTTAVLALGLAAWLFLAMRRFLAPGPGGIEPRWMTALKFVTLAFAYWIAFGVTVFAVMIAAVMSG